MKPDTIRDLLFKQEFRAWGEVHDALSPQGYLGMYSFFDGKDRATLLQIVNMRSRMLEIVWNETQKDE